MTNPESRRRFLATGAAALLAALLPGPAAARAPRRAADPRHPTPRPGITGEKVLTAEQLSDAPDLVPLFDGVRAIPEIVDGIRCSCGCAEQPGHYSLLSCYEDGMAKQCRICQGQGALAVRLRKQGRSLDEIREAIDSQYG
jgi:hypothetical protein